MLGSASLDTCFNRAWLTPGDPSFGLFLDLRGVQAHHRLVHGDNVVEPGLGVAVDSGDEFLAHPHSLLHLFLGEKFGNPSGRLF